MRKKWGLGGDGKKGKCWVGEKYWDEIGGGKWRFGWKYERKRKKVK